MTRPVTLFALSLLVAGCASPLDDEPVADRSSPDEIAAWAGTDEITINVAGTEMTWSAAELCSVQRHPVGSVASYDAELDRVIVEPPVGSLARTMAVECTCVGEDTGGCSPFEGTIKGVPISGCTKGCTRCDGTSK